MIKIAATCEKSIVWLIWGALFARIHCALRVRTIAERFSCHLPMLQLLKFHCWHGALQVLKMVLNSTNVVKCDAMLKIGALRDCYGDREHSKNRIWESMKSFSYTSFWYRFFDCELCTGDVGVSSVTDGNMQSTLHILLFLKENEAEIWTALVLEALWGSKMMTFGIMFGKWRWEENEEVR